MARVEEELHELKGIMVKNIGMPLCRELKTYTKVACYDLDNFNVLALQVSNRSESYAGEFRRGGCWDV